MTVDPDLLTAMSERMVRATPQAVAMGMRLVTTLLDHVCGLAVLTAVGQDNSTATLDLRIDYMRAAEPGREVIGHATCYKLGRSIAFVRAVAFDRDEADPVATAQGAFALSGLRTAA
jgi:acyl-coenzyme A thioesterase PaaI-like protein